MVAPHCDGVCLFLRPSLCIREYSPENARAPITITILPIARYHVTELMIELVRDEDWHNEGRPMSKRVNRNDTDNGVWPCHE